MPAGTNTVNVFSTLFAPEPAFPSAATDTSLIAYDTPAEERSSTLTQDGAAAPGPTFVTMTLTVAASPVATLVGGSTRATTRSAPSTVTTAGSLELLPSFSSATFERQSAVAFQVKP